MERRTHFLKIQRGSTSQYSKMKTAGNTHQLKITDGEIYQDTESKLEAHSLPEQKRF
jgi:hypothetical protein